MGRIGRKAHIIQVQAQWKFQVCADPGIWTLEPRPTTQNVFCFLSFIFYPPFISFYAFDFIFC
jgi:hypothetical protein